MQKIKQKGLTLRAQGQKCIEEGACGSDYAKVDLS